MTGAFARISGFRSTVPKVGLALRGLRSGWAYIAPHLAPHKRAMAVSGLATCIYVMARLAEPWFLKIIVDNVFLENASEGPQGTTLDPMSLLALLIGALFCTAFLGAIARYLQRTRAARIGLAVGHGLRTRLFTHTLLLSPKFHANRRAGDLVVRLMSDVRILTQAFVSTPIRTFEEILLLTGMFAMMFYIDWQLTLMAAVALPLALMLLKRHHSPMRDAVRQQRKRESQLAATASEALSAIEVIQIYGREKSEVSRFGKAAKKDLSSGLKSARLEGQLNWAIEFAVGLATAALIWVAVGMIDAKTLTPGELIVFAYYMTMFYQPIRRLSRTFKRVSRAATAAERVKEIFSTRLEIDPTDNADEMPAIKGDIKFERVSLDLDRRPVLKDVNLHVEAGERVTLIGPSGAGKSTLVSLVARLMDPGAGRVLVDGRDLRDYPVAALRRQVAFAPQDPLLFSGTLADNVSLGLTYPATVQDMDAAARAAGVEEMICGLPHRWMTRISESGTSLSGGQKRAVSLVRAMLRKAPIIVFDEPTTGLDRDNACRVTQAIANVAGQSTVIVITHDMTQILPNSRVLKVEDGRVFSQSGTVSL